MSLIYYDCPNFTPPSLLTAAAESFRLAARLHIVPLSAGPQCTEDLPVRGVAADRAHQQPAHLGPGVRHQGAQTAALRAQRVLQRVGGAGREGGGDW